MENEKLINEYLTYLLVERNLSKNTIQRSGYVLNNFKSFSKNKFEYLTAEDIHNYVVSLNNIDSASSVNNTISILKSFYNYLFLSNKISKNITENIKSLKTPKRLPKYLTIEELDKLLNFPLHNKFDYRNKAAFETMYATGIRVSELTNLKIEDIDFENDILRTISKGSKERIIPISDIALKYLKIYINEYRPLFIKNKINNYIFLNGRGEVLTRNAFNLIIKQIALKQGITSYLTPHVLRHSFATHMIEAGADIRSVQELLGHENVITTEIYTHLSNKYLKNNYEEYFPRK